MAYGLTDKSKDLIKTQVIDGSLYAYCMTNDAGDEIWLKVKPIQAPVCSQCGYAGPLQRHHIYGRKNSPETILVCPTCHNEIHEGIREIKIS